MKWGTIIIFSLLTWIIFLVVTMRSSNHNTVCSPSKLLHIRTIISKSYRSPVIRKIFIWYVWKRLKILHIYKNVLYMLKIHMWWRLTWYSWGKGPGYFTRLQSATELPSSVHCVSSGSALTFLQYGIGSLHTKYITFNLYPWCIYSI